MRVFYRGLASPGLLTEEMRRANYAETAEWVGR